MKRRQVLSTLPKAAKAAGLLYDEEELTRHTGVIVGSKRSTLARHNEVDEVTVGRFYKQFEDVLGEGWWR